MGSHSSNGQDLEYGWATWKTCPEDADKKFDRGSSLAAVRMKPYLVPGQIVITYIAKAEQNMEYTHRRPVSGDRGVTARWEKHIGSGTEGTPCGSRSHQKGQNDGSV